MKRLLIALIFFTCASSLYAVLPPIAGLRQKEVFDYRQRKRIEYEQAQQKHEAAMVYREQQVRQEMTLSPWGKNSGTISAKSTEGKALAVSKTGDGKRVKGRVFAVVAVLFFGGCIWWVRRVTGGEAGRCGGDV